jgi:hypothetical protein
MGKIGSHTVGSLINEETCFFTLVRSQAGAQQADFLIKSLRAFGGPLQDSPFFIFFTRPGIASQHRANDEGVHFVQLEVEAELQNYWFGEKVAVCSEAEAMLDGNVQSLIWMNPESIIVNPPNHFHLGSSCDAAFRPVHIQNVGIRIDEEMDPFWSEIYRIVELRDIPYNVESFVDAQTLLPYFNTHLFSINPSLSVLRTWLDTFRRMVADRVFQAEACADIRHQIFLHQAILSTLLIKLLDWERIEFLPPEYSYPLHLHHEIPLDRQADSLNGLVCPVFESGYQHPDTLNGIEVQEPVLSWILKNKPVQVEERTGGGNE